MTSAQSSLLLIFILLLIIIYLWGWSGTKSTITAAIYWATLSALDVIVEQLVK
jgi:hypothetical protein